MRWRGVSSSTLLVVSDNKGEKDMGRKIARGKARVVLVLCFAALGGWQTATIAAAANGGGQDAGTSGQHGQDCAPGYHDTATGSCEHNGAGGGNCGDNQSGNNNGLGNDGNDNGFGHVGDMCDATSSPPTPPSPPPTCTGGQTIVNGSCQCPQGQTLTNGQCGTPNPPPSDPPRSNLPPNNPPSNNPPPNNPPPNNPPPNNPPPNHPPPNNPPPNNPPPNNPPHGTLRPPLASISIVKLEKIDGAGADYATGPIAGAVGQTADYKVVVKNTGAVTVTVSLDDKRCSNVTAQGSQTIGPGKSVTYWCTHVLTTADGSSYTNTASAIGETSGGQAANARPVRVTIYIAPRSPAAVTHEARQTKHAKHLKKLTYAKPAKKAIVKAASFTG